MSMPVVNAKARQTASVIFLHGLGDTGHGWCAGFEEIAEPFIKYLCPTAKIQPVSVNFGMKMPSWFDIKSLGFDADEDKAGIQHSSEFLKSLVQEEIKNGIPSEKILIGGFSQGGAVALYTAFTSDIKFGGVIALSTWLPLHRNFPEANTGKNSTTPIFQGHGDLDPVIPHKFGQMTHQYIQKMNNQATFKSYPGVQHGSSPQMPSIMRFRPFPAKEMHDVKEFVRSCLS